MKDSVELCQRFGRARREESCIVVLDERPDRPVEKLESVQRLQESIVQGYTPQQGAPSQAEEEAKQRNREQAAVRSILSNKRKQEYSSVAELNEFVNKMTGLLEESCCKSGTTFSHRMTYRTILRSVPDIVGSGMTKKEAKRNCALNMLSKLEQEMASMML